MRLADTVRFRKDLLFDGAVQLGWFEEDRELASKAAEHYVFHGPTYHGVDREDLSVTGHSLVDTATFTLDILEHISGQNPDEPFTMAIAGYGTGKSHLAITLACLLSAPDSSVSDKILGNMSMADAKIGKQAKEIIKASDRPFLVIALNGMQDFDLSAEIIRQIVRILNKNGLDTTPLEDLRRRFRIAIHFTESFFSALKEEFADAFGKCCEMNEIIEELRCQDEETFIKVSDIYQHKMGAPIRAVGLESLNDFIRVTKETYCGDGKPFAGIVIMFDEFGRYLEFSVQKPHVAGSGALQQLFECVQANADGVFLLCFIQYELKAYISRVAPEMREDLNRYVTRYDAVRKVRLSTNLETLMANLLEKRDDKALEQYLAQTRENTRSIQMLMKRWFPDMKNHALWMDENRFDRVICKGCWPFHPCSTWTLHKLASIGKSLQQRSALSLLADAYRSFEDMEFGSGATITPVDLCNQDMINEFLTTERYGQQGAIAHGYESVLRKYQNELLQDEKMALRAVLISAKIGIKVESKQDYIQALVMLSGQKSESIETAVHSLEREYAVLEWNDLLNQYEIAGDAIPRKTFLQQLGVRAADIDSSRRAEIFTQKSVDWGVVGKTYNTDFGPENMISTREWNYKIHVANVSILKGQIRFAVRTWRDSIEVDKQKGQLIYCYVGPESNIESIKESTLKTIRLAMEEEGIDFETGIPLAVLLLYDTDGTFGQRIAEYWVLDDQMNEEESKKYEHFILERRNSLEQEMQNQFSELERAKHIVPATNRQLTGSRIMNILAHLFDVVYPNRIPFPFDGFHTATGNAARDNQSFTRALFTGTLDHDWITSRSRQQRNRAHKVLVEAWGIIGSDGSLRRIPSNKKVNHIIEVLQSELHGEGDGDRVPMSMGKAMTVLHSPPYGCNIASAGLLLAYFVGSRKNDFQLYQNGQAISTDKWLQNALPGKFLSSSILGATDLVQVSKESVSEWELVLDQWELADTLVEKESLLVREQDLDKRIPVPQQLYYRREHLRTDARMAARKLREFEEKLALALEKVQRGIDFDDFPRLSWGAADLAGIHNYMRRNQGEWTAEQVDEVQNHYADARQETKGRFSKWLRQQKVFNRGQLEDFKYRMRVNIGGNLSKLGFEDERQQLDEHVDRIEQHIDFLTELRTATSDIDNMILTSIVTNETKVSVLNDWLCQAKELYERLDKAKDRKDKDIDQSDIRSAAMKLTEFATSCKDQLELYKSRTTAVFNIRELSSLSDIANWRNEVASLIQVYEGQERNVEDLKLVQRQLDLIETHHNQLDNDSLDEDAFTNLSRRCKEQNYEAFADDAPPLDNEHIYSGIMECIGAKREQRAADWLSTNIPSNQDIKSSDAPTVNMYRTQLLDMPPYLSSKQREVAYQALQECEKRLDDLEVEGILHRFLALSKENKRAFLREIRDHIKAQDPETHVPA